MLQNQTRALGHLVNDLAAEKHGFVFKFKKEDNPRVSQASSSVQAEDVEGAN